MKTQQWCEHDQKWVLAERADGMFEGTTSILIMILLCLMTCGAGFVVWVILFLIDSSKDKSFRCPICGSKTTPAA